MNTEIFWRVIEEYNQSTIWIQAALMLFLTAAMLWAYVKKKQRLALAALGIINVYIGIVFFLLFGTEPIQTFFAAPLFLIVGLLFGYEAVKAQDNPLVCFDKVQWILFILIILYPVASLLLGNTFPQMTVYIMPCPVISLSIIFYSSCRRKNKLLLLLLSIWGLTGIKAFFANALEDVILLICGGYCVYLLAIEIKRSDKWHL